jgi:hypothetical protein
MNEEIGRLTEGLAAEKKVREETENVLLKMLEDMCNRMQGEINQERRDREQTEETLLKLLEETCSRVEIGLRH